MQVGIPVAYNVREEKLDKINHWFCVQREDFQLRWCVKIYVKSWISHRVCKNNERSDWKYSHNKTNKYVRGTKTKSLDIGST